MRDLDKLSPLELFVLQAAISEELRRRGITRSFNKMIWLNICSAARLGGNQRRIRYVARMRSIGPEYDIRLRPGGSHYRVWRAVLIPHARMAELVWKFSDVRDVTEELRQAEWTWAEAISEG